MKINNYIRISLLLLLCMFVSQKGLADTKTISYNFSDNKTGLSTTSNPVAATTDGTMRLKIGNKNNAQTDYQSQDCSIITSFSTYNVDRRFAAQGVSVQYDNSGNVDVSSGWIIRQGNLQSRMNGKRAFAIRDLYAGDKVKIKFDYTQGTSNSYFWQGSSVYINTPGDVHFPDLSNNVELGTELISETEFTVQKDGYVSILFGNYVRIYWIEITREETPSLSFEKLSDEGYIGELTALAYTEPELTHTPAGAKVTFTSNNEKVVKIGGEAHDGDLMFINTGVATITASMTVGGVEYSDSYTVTVSADDATWEVDGTTYRVTGAGKLQDRVVTQVPYITMEFGSTDVVNTTIVRNETTDDGTATSIGFVATTIDQNGWRQIWPETEKSTPIVPYQGTFYTFKPAVGGTLSFSGYSTRDNTTVLVDATEGYNIVKTYDFTSQSTLINEEGYEVTAGHTYYLYGNTPNTNTDTSKEGWNTFQLNSFGFVPAFHFEKKSDRVAAGTKTYTQAVKGAGSNTTYSVETRGDITSASVDNQGNVTLTYDEGMGGAVVVTAEDSGLKDYYVLTIPYSYATDKTWTMWNTVETFTKEKMQERTSDWGVNYEVRTYNAATRALTYLNKAVMVANSSVNGTNAYYLDETAGLWFKSNAKNFGARMNNWPNAL